MGGLDPILQLSAKLMQRPKTAWRTPLEGQRAEAIALIFGQFPAPMKALLRPRGRGGI